MDADDLLESLAWGLPFLAIAGVFWTIAVWKRGKGEGLHAEARRALAEDRRADAHDLLRKALWKANEEPELERAILGDLARLYREAGVPFSARDYEVLIGQYERLRGRGSHKAFSELKQVQVLKRELIAAMPALG